MSDQDSSWQEPGFNIQEGRYFDHMGIIHLPAGSFNLEFGGDLCGMIWQFEAKPDEWILTYRMRYNAGHNTDPFANVDRKSWHAVKHNEGDKTRREFIDFFGTIPLYASAKMKAVLIPDIDWLVIQGGPDKFFEVVEREKKPWMHLRKMSKAQAQEKGII
jgi:hypothetical protein